VGLPFLPPFLPFLGVGEVLFEGAADALEKDEGVAPGLVGEVEGEEAEINLCVCFCVFVFLCVCVFCFVFVFWGVCVCVCVCVCI